MDKESYHLDLSQISLSQFQGRLESGDVLPGRAILQEDTAARFAVLAGQGITNLDELARALKTKKKVAELAQASGLDARYLTILRREVNSHQPSPVNLDRFPGIEEAVVARLVDAGMRTSRQIYEATGTAAARAALAAQADIDPAALGELCALSDLVRVSGVGPVFARMLFDVGVQSTRQLAGAQPALLFEQLMVLNQEKAYTRAAFTEKDVVTIIGLAQMLPKR